MREDQKECGCGYVRDDAELASHCKICNARIPIGETVLCSVCQKTYMKCRKCGKIQPIMPNRLCRECREKEQVVVHTVNAVTNKTDTPVPSPQSNRGLIMALVAVIALLVACIMVNPFQKKPNSETEEKKGAQALENLQEQSEELTGETAATDLEEGESVSSYMVMQEPCSWSEANEKCRQLDEENERYVHLVTINSMDEFCEVCDTIDLYNQSKSQEDSLYYVWVGASIPADEDWSRDSKWVDGTSIELLWEKDLWWPNEPSNTDTIDEQEMDENCLQLWKARFPDKTDHGWTFNDSIDKLTDMGNIVSSKRIGYVIEFE